MFATIHTATQTNRNHIITGIVGGAASEKSSELYVTMDGSLSSYQSGYTLFEHARSTR